MKRYQIAISVTEVDDKIDSYNTHNHYVGYNKIVSEWPSVKEFINKVAERLEENILSE